jgi:hypothetical protein
MTPRRIALFTLVAAAALLTGCARTKTFQVAVRNETTEPLTVGFAKEEGGPFEPNWATPEEVAIDSPSYSERNWDSVVVPPGRTGVAGPIQGKFDSAARAFLRIYGATGSLNDLLAISRGSPRRADVPLAPGRNALVVREEAGKLMVERVQLAPRKQ